ncbi:Glycerol-3-phosphate regulon repressor [Aliiroseovarius sp. xm-m-379]|uniref:DeoR/GlpR family DNA-binding transcription regulator n=1 Tax=unclassified Aliiroseovarius TaxID=2623558 RepID=UPI0019EB340D|nr:MULTISPECIES: DeoR/GlpR family DNA-binding transcription regulator [unclassified Aliiroseovarius]NRP13070.1 Glycerol-3-phosphate regulon repressor [Aliiroseovarius sp. xm-d-517]NRP32896.1 Glycerol-3-phosphate regulon repressor [Aliiroseovarius sp. xm-a-104]NRP40455.1 Glycerol-3-phosphate regulon repressor [Aliiroseovarius sp. xm-m-339-2]NRP43196.1 Glycerol-3-phosphate regulon repressor [Aliiroseovarius sp. xm-m-378]NRP49659.1 Glycerol-3-phosphate regulon repressor [Aliiroseovarius sp. xm-m-
MTETDRKTQMTDASNLSHRELELLTALRRLGGAARSSELAKHLDVSEETVRRGIKALSKTGSVARVHGGAYLVGGAGDPSFFQRMARNPEEKRQIAKLVARQVADNMTVFLDVGSTTAFVAERLRKHTGLTVVTNSIAIAQAMLGTSGNRVHFLGGEMKSDERGTFGSVTERQAQRFAFDLAVLSVDGLSEKRGFLFVNPVEAALSEVVADRADRVVIGLDHQKYGVKAPHCGLDAHRVDLLIVDKAPDKGLTRALDGWGVEVALAPAGKGGMKA